MNCRDGKYEEFRGIDNEISSKCQIWIPEGAIEEMREVQDLEEKFEESYCKTFADRTDYSDLRNTKNSKWIKYKEIHTLA